MRKLIVLLGLVLLVASVNAAVLEEFSLKAHGLSDLVVEGENKEACLDFVFFKEMPLEKAGEYVFFSVNAEFQPTTEGKASISVSLNDSVVAELAPEDFENGWARVLFQRNNLVDGNNSVIACAKTSKAITKVVLKNDSLLGTYKSPDFSQANAFQQVPSNYFPLEGETIDVSVRLKNYGSEKTHARMMWRKEGIVRPELELIEGDTSKEGDIEPGQELVMDYKIKLNQALKLDLPSAIAYYVNVFGEEKIIESDRPTLDVLKPNIDLQGFFLVDESIIYDKKEASVLLAVHNNGSRARDVKLTVLAPEGISTEGMPNEIALIEEKETKYLQLNLIAEKLGEYRLDCLLELPDFNKSFSCQEKVIEFKEKGVSSEIGIAGIVVIVGVLLYLYAYSASRKT